MREGSQAIGVRSYRQWVLALVSSGALFGCGTEQPAAVTREPDPLLPERDADELFYGELPTFEIEMLDTSWETFRARGAGEQYSAAALRFNGDYVGQIAVRVKGQYSIELCYPEGEPICDKLSLRFKFDAHDEKQRFFGLKRLNLHSLRNDVSHLRERLAYDLFREMDVPVSRSAWAKLVVDGAPQGLYSMVEEVDGVFTDDRFDKHGDGDLYKEVWPTSLDTNYYEKGLETNEETADASKVVAFARSLTEPETAAERLAVLGEFMDLEALNRYMAVDDAVANWDGVTTFYEDHGGNNHNFFLYVSEPGQTPPFVLIPWDMDNTFQAANWRNRAPGWRDATSDCELTSGVYPPTCDPLLSALVLDQERYTAAVNTLLDGPFAEKEMSQRIADFARFIEQPVAEDPFGPSVAAWKKDVAEVERNVGLLREQLKVFAKGETVRRVGFDPERVNDFTGVTPLEAELGVSVYAAVGVTGRVAVVDDGELTGLMLSFSMPSEEEGPWVSFGLAFPRGDKDLRGLTGLRLRAQATGVPAYARLRIESSASTEPSVAWNWQLDLDASATTYDLQFDDLFWSESGQEPDLPLETWLEHANGISFVFAGGEGEGAVEIDDVEVY